MTKKVSPGAGTAVAVGCLAILAVIALWLALVAFGGLILMIAWNLVFPSLFGWPELTYPMAFGLSLFIGIVGSAFSRVTTVSK